MLWHKEVTLDYNYNLEKRISTRHPVEGPITLHSTIGAPREIHARVLNCSEEGICFYSRKRLSPGVTILFKSSNCKYLRPCSDEKECILRSISFVTVKWCKEVLQDDGPIFLMGAAYIMPQ